MRSLLDDVPFASRSGHGSGKIKMSAKDQGMASTELFDQFVGAREQRRREGETKTSCRLLVDKQLELGWLIDRDVARIGSV